LNQTASRFGDWFFGRKGSPRPEVKDPGPSRNPKPSDMPDGYVMMIKNIESGWEDVGIRGLEISINGPGIDHDRNHDKFTIEVLHPNWFEVNIFRQEMKDKVRRTMWKLVKRSEGRWRKVRTQAKQVSQTENLKDNMTGTKRAEDARPAKRSKPPAPR